MENNKSKIKFKKINKKINKKTVKNIKINHLKIDFDTFKIINDKDEFKKNFHLKKIEFKGEKYHKIVDLKQNRAYIMDIHKVLFIINSDNKTIYLVNKNGLITNNEKINHKIKKLKNTNFKGIYRDFRSKLKELNWEILKLIPFKSCYYHNSKDIVEKLDELNKKLQSKCELFKLVLNRYYLLKGKVETLLIDDKNKEGLERLVLCLYKNDKCVSNIELDYDERDGIYVSISSRTEESERGNKYNTLLRSVVIQLVNEMICNKFKIESLLSEAIEPISIWSLLMTYKCNYFVKSVEDNEELNKFLDVLYDKVDKKDKSESFKKDFMKYMKETEVDITIPLTDENIKIAEKTFNDCLKNIC